MARLIVESSKRTAPYLPFKTFLSSLDALSHGMPPAIDRSIWKTQSGVYQGMIMAAYRFFGLVDEDDRSTDELHELVDHPDKRPEIMRALIEMQYEDIVSMDLTRMTAKMLDEAFDEYAVAGATKRKAVTFFLQAAKFSDIALSPFLISQIRNVSTRRKKLSKPKGGYYVGEMNGAADPAYSPPLQPPPGSGEKSVRLTNGGVLRLSITADVFTLPPDDRKFVFELIDKLREYEQRNVPKALPSGGDAQ